MPDSDDCTPAGVPAGAIAADGADEVMPGTSSTAELIERGQDLERRGQRPAARETYRAALAQLGDEQVAAKDVHLLRWIARTHQVDAEYEDALRFLAMAEALATERGERGALGHCLNLRAIVSWQRGDLDDAARLYGVALDLARETGDAHLAAVAAQNLGVVASARGDHSQARQYYGASLGAYKALGIPRDICIAQNNLGRLYLEQGEWDEAAAAFAEAFDLAGSVGESSVCTMIDVNIAEMWVRRGDHGKAREACDRAMAREPVAGESLAAAEAQKIYGVIALARGDTTGAERHFDTADSIAARREDLLLRAQIARERAELYRGQGRTRDLLQTLNGAHKLFTQIRARQAAAEVTAQTARLERDVLDVVRRWGESIEEKDEYTQGHCERVADLACALANRSGIEAGTLFWFRVGALLHDVGKIVISSEILNKPGKLSADEWAVMKLHPGAGAEILKEIDFPYDVIPSVRSHHENWDGSGYPDGLRGEQIPLWARIVCLADVYDALTSERSYKRALAHDEAIEVMRRDVRRQFDPALFLLFEEVAKDVVPRPVRATVTNPHRPAAATTGAEQHDDLTGLLVRRGFLALAQDALTAGSKEGKPLSLAVIDVDHFKLVNDTFGHLQGDDVLRAVAGQMRDAVRRQDIVGRYAGDEFVILLPDTPLETAMQVAERVCDSVGSNRLAIRDRREGTIGVTLSIGVVTATDGTEDVEALFAAADRALYVAKRRGRNQVASADEADGEARGATLQFDRFVGRVREIRTLIGQLEAACAGQPRVVAVVGEAGIGKTALVRQLLPEVRLRGGTMVTGRCLATDVKPPYGAWAEIIEAIHALNVVPAGEWKELARLVPALGNGSTPPPTASSKYALLAELSDYLRQACTRLPLTVVLDDVQWADSSTWDALEYVRHNLDGDRMLICMTMRAEDAGAVAERRRHLSRDERFSDLSLQRFTEEELCTWLETLLHQGDIGRDFLRFIHGYTEGNPLLVVHVLRSLQEDGGIWYAGRRWQWKDSPELRLPTAVADLIDSRIERMSEEARQRLTIAAVVGRAFDLDVVLAAGEMSEEELLDALDEGIAAHVVEAIGDRDSDRFAFSHGLIADAIRRGVHRRRLTRMHGQVAAALERLRANAVAEIAAHYDAAGNTSKAYEFAMRAAERAVGVYAHDEAASSYALAERNAPTVADRLHCQFRHAKALELSGDYEGAEALCDLIIAERVSAGDRDPLIAVRRSRERLRGLRGQSLQQTNDAVQQLLAEATDRGDWREEVELLGMLSRVVLRRGNPAEARALGLRSAQVAERNGDPGMLANTLMHLGSAVIGSDAGEALTCYQRALETFTALSDLLGQARANINLGIVHSRMGASDESTRAYETALDLGRRIHSPDLTGLAALNLGVLHMKLGHLAEADACLSEAMERFALLHNEPHRLAALYNQANLARERHELERAARLYGDAAVVATSMNQLDVEVGARAGQGLAFLAQGRIDDARACLQSCAVRVRDQPDWWFQGRELLEALAVRLFLHRGDATAAADRFATGLAIAENADQYGAAWLVAEVAGPLADAGVTAAREQVGRFARRVEELDYSTLTARYALLREEGRTDSPLAGAALSEDAL